MEGALVQAEQVVKIARAPRNVVASIDNTDPQHPKLVLVCDLSVDLGPSSTGKSNLVASGTAKVPGFPRAGFGVNVWYR
jgi:hypothetical protein